MRKLFVLVGMALLALLAVSSSAAASTTCNTTLTGQTISGDLVVPEDGVCTIVNTTVGDDVKVGANAYFEADNSQIGDDLNAENALTIFTHDGTTVGDDVEAEDTFQAFLYDGTIDGHIQIARTTDKVQICGNTVNGRIQVRDSGRDILVGDPEVGCGGNTVLDHHRIRVEDNSVDVELVVRRNTVQGGDLEVNDNSGTADKLVQDNVGGYELECRGNDDPFTASGNTGWDRKEGQCAVPPQECNTTLNGAAVPDDLVVPENGACTLTGGSVGGDVKVGKNAFFQATGTQIGGEVEGNGALTLFIDTGTTVGGEVDASGTFQVFVFGATLKDDLQVSRSEDKVQACGNTIDGDVEVEHSGRDILFGDPTPGADCTPNTVQNGHSASFENNSTDVEFTIRGNTFQGGDLTVDDNRGPSDKFVQNNTGGNVLDCSGNETPFTGTPNGFTTEEGQCAEI